MNMTVEEALNIWLLAIKTGVETMPECKEALDIAAKALEQIRWIPVSKRLPEAEYGESDSVLVCFEDETQDILYFNGGNWCYPTGETYISVNHKNGWHNKVVAWMPRPKPYKPQEGNDKCSKCGYYVNPDYTRCKECGEESENKE